MTLIEKEIKFVYAAGAMGFYGEGHWFHKFYDFPKVPFITKTLTLSKKIGSPFAIIPLGKSVWNKVSLHNPGLFNWKKAYDSINPRPGFTDNYISVYPYTQEQLDYIINKLHYWFGDGVNVEINMSCPNVKGFELDKVPFNIKKYIGVNIWVKLNYKQIPLEINLENIKGIRLNSLPTKFGGLSGKFAQEKNWEYIQKYNKYIDISGCSWTTKSDLCTLINMGCKEISIGSVMITNPRLVESLRLYCCLVSRGDYYE